MLSLRIDPWAASYESALQIAEDEQTPQVAVDPLVETEDWGPRQPEAQPAPERIAFIDGVQRVELRVIGDEDGRLVYGAFASVAAGAAITAAGQVSTITGSISRRIIALGGGARCQPWQVPCGTSSLTFHPEPAADDGPDAWQKAVGRARRESEQALGRRLVDSGLDLVIIDGRLTFPLSRRSPVIGVAKTLRTQYLAAPYSSILRELRTGTRTPLFSIAYEDHPVYSWYLRLAEPRPVEHEWAGLVQVETMAGIGREEAIRLADITALHLPRFASHAGWDPRAPQNMFPISALEYRLRHELGDHEWVRRNLESQFYRSGGVS